MSVSNPDTASHLEGELTQDLDRVLLGNEVDDLESVLNNSDGHDLLTVVSAVHHEAMTCLVWPRHRSPRRGDSRVNESLDNGHSALGELLLGVSTGSVGNVDGVVDVDIVLEGDVLDLDAGVLSALTLMVLPGSCCMHFLVFPSSSSSQSCTDRTHSFTIVKILFIPFRSAVPLS